MVTIILAIAISWLALSVAAGLLFARMATLHKRSNAPAKEVEVEPGPRLQLAPALPSGHEHVA